MLNISNIANLKLNFFLSYVFGFSVLDPFKDTLLGQSHLHGLEMSWLISSSFF